VCGGSVAKIVIVKYPHHDGVEFELCRAPAAKTTLAHIPQRQVLGVVPYPYQSEGWLKPRR
jgi:hypothetical protein